MNEVLKAIQERRSTRGFNDDQLTDEQLQALIDAALASPTARNTQMWHFSVVQNRELLDEIQRHIRCQAEARSLRLSSSSIAESHPLVQRAIALGRTPFGSPTLSDQALMSFPSLKMGPGESSRSHTADEYICTVEIAEAIRLYLQLLDGTAI